MHADHHLFLSYARADNEPKTPGGEGWVTAFEREIRARHLRYSGRELRVFFDTGAIGLGRDWQRELGAGLRSARLFLAFLSPRYLASENCLWEWEQYVRREHSSARGDDGITPIFFVTPENLVAPESPLAGDARAKAWLADLHRRNRTAECDLQPWFDRGPELLRRLDAAERSAELREHPCGVPLTPDGVGADDLRSLADRL